MGWVKASTGLLASLLLLTACQDGSIRSIRDMDKAATAGALNRSGTFELHVSALDVSEGLYLSDTPCGHPCWYVVTAEIPTAMEGQPEIKAFHENLSLQNRREGSKLVVDLTVKPMRFAQKLSADGAKRTYVTDVTIVSVNSQILE